jgi:eukaryotic-like serine/threonine-protein kinase
MGDSVESPHTLLKEPPGWEPLPQEGKRRRLFPRALTPASEDPPPGGGLLLGRYRMLERLGSGGFGVVWRARDELLGREVAVKRIPLAPDGDSERATREALATARLSHPAIVALYEAHSEPDCFYLISELVRGQTLSQLIADDALEDERLLQIGVTLARALSHAHARGVIHRDVKPQNVLVPHVTEAASQAPDGPLAVAKLTDFGGASLVDQDALTRTGDVLGTLAYMAPEQCEGEKVDEQTDLYALALVLYEGLSGVNPVRGPTPAATARRIGRPLPPLARSRRDLPRSLTRALDAALAPAPEERGTLDDLQFALEETLQRGLGRRRRRAPRRSSAERLDRRPTTPVLVPAARHVEPEPPVARRRLQAPEGEIASLEAPGARAPAERLALPRAMWLGLPLAAILWLIISGRPGVALLALAAAAPLVALPRRTGPGWLACVLAPVLGAVGLAGAFPAIAGQASRWRERAALAAVGYWWLTLAEPLTGRRLWLGQSSAASQPMTWEGSLSGAAHVLAPLLGLGALLGAALWASGAIVLPWIVRGRSAALDVVVAASWSAAIAAAAPMLDSGLSAHAAHPSPRGALLGAILGGAIAVAARALRGPI